MKYSHPRIGDGREPRGRAITNEIDKNRRQPPQNFVPLKKRRQMGNPDPPDPLRWGGALKKTRKVKVTLAKITQRESP